MSWLCVGGLTILIFSLGMFFGSVVGSNIRVTEAYVDFTIAQDDRRQRYLRNLEYCTQAEVRINAVRDELVLERYTKGEVCPMLGIWPSDLARDQSPQ